MIKRFYNITIAIEAIMINKLKTTLTTLGIIFGVASVIVMMSIGKGAKKEILDQMEEIGSNNIWVQSAVVPGADAKSSRSINYGDYLSIKEVLQSNTKRISPVYTLPVTVKINHSSAGGKLYGVESSYFDIFSISLFRGSFFTDLHTDHALPVCVISASLASKLFPKTEVLNKRIKCNDSYLLVIGIYKTRNTSLAINDNQSIEFLESDIYLPAKSLLMRFGNESLTEIESEQSVHRMPFMTEGDIADDELPELASIVVQLKHEMHQKPAMAIISRLLERRKRGTESFTVFAPEIVLKQQQRSREIFNIVLGTIAGISLLVGGIGIMNIMYASIVDRIKEIGTRLAVGASRHDILEQFLAEAVLISCTGGLIGIVLGIILAKATSYFFDIQTLISVSSIFIAFIVSVGVGILFGYIPARNASKKDPVESLTYF